MTSKGRFSTKNLKDQCAGSGTGRPGTAPFLQGPILVMLPHLVHEERARSATIIGQPQQRMVLQVSFHDSWCGVAPFSVLFEKTCLWITWGNCLDGDPDPHRCESSSWLYR